MRGEKPGATGSDRAGARAEAADAARADGIAQDAGRRGRSRNEATSALIDAIFPTAAMASSGDATPSGFDESHIATGGPALSFASVLGQENQADADAQALLTGAVEKLIRRTGSMRAFAWLQPPGRDVYVAAAHVSDDEVMAPGSELFEALRVLPHATDLGEAKLPEVIRELADDDLLSAAIPIRSEASRQDDDPAPAVLILGGPLDPSGYVRPRTLANLEDVAKEIGAPLSRALEADQFSDVDGAIQRLDRLASLGDLLSEVVHEVRNPLVSMKTFLQLLPERLNDPDFHEGFREIVVDELARLERLIDSVLSHARPVAGRRISGATAVEASFETIAALVAHRARTGQVTLEIAVADGLPEVEMNRDALRQVVLNLMLNALEVTPAGGCVTLRAELSKRQQGYVELAVEDQGPGVPKDDRPRIFDAFHSTRKDRVGGLGLAICKRLVEEAGGAIEVGDAPGRGACFTFTLPAAS